MSKKERVALILKLLNEKGFGYEILSQSKGIPNHIRVKKFGDIWPSTGSFRKGGKLYKREYSKLVDLLGGEQPEQKKSNTQRIEVIEDILDRLFKEIESIKQKVS